MIYGSGNLTEKVKQYQVIKHTLETALKDNLDFANIPDTEKIRSMEIELDHAFGKVLSSRPQNLSDVLVKASLLIGEILIEAELTSYQKRALQNILDDLKTISER